ncbi:MAG TPA: SDR family NAD(P)-dependent oxidoreductase, partial [Rugosimonospora sp.]|nr:SDR family NAD(P)-dependent oxidoreductase [Rugosimonospora sp.]
MAERFQGGTALVTGAAAGIGAACAQRLAAEGARVVLLDIQPATEVVACIEHAGGQAVAVTADVAEEAAWAAAVDLAHDRFGPVDTLVSNAYTVEFAPADATSRESWDRQLAVNLTATFLGVRACLADLRAR